MVLRRAPASPILVARSNLPSHGAGLSGQPQDASLSRDHLFDAMGEVRRAAGSPVPSIHERPLEVAARGVAGHWEGDLLLGSGEKVAIGTLVERCARLTLLARLEGMSVKAARDGFERKLREVPRRLRQTMTYDRGEEMAEYRALSLAAKKLQEGESTLTAISAEGCDHAERQST